MSGMLGSSTAFRALLAQVGRFARTNHPILILGAPGTGKTELARFIHRQSGRTGRMVRFPLTSVPDELRHAELFGHAKGAFTGADHKRDGAVEDAHGGTLFLDELGVATPGVQASLLTVLDDASVRRIGETRYRPVDVRIIAATNEDLDQQVLAGGFRRDLLARFGFFRVLMPDLADRPEDIMPLFRHFLRLEQRAQGEPSDPEVTDQVGAVLLAAPWADNVRELANVARYAMVCRDPGQAIDVHHLPPEFLATIGAAVAGPELSSRIPKALELTGGNCTKAAAMLGVSRSTFYRHLPAADQKPA